jgi:hypothetical protein
MIVLPIPNILPAVEVRALEIDIEYWQHWKLATFPAALTATLPQP